MWLSTVLMNAIVVLSRAQVGSIAPSVVSCVAMLPSAFAVQTSSWLDVRGVNASFVPFGIHDGSLPEETTGVPVTAPSAVAVQTAFPQLKPISPFVPGNAPPWAA